MEVWNYFVDALETLCSWQGVLYIVCGTMAGIILGAIPGLGGGTLVLVLLPLAYKMDIVLCMALFISINIGGISGGFIGSVLLGIPGTTSSLCTVWDGYEFTKRGDPVRPLSVAATCNFIGTVPSILLAIFTCKLIATWAVKLGPWEYAAMCFCAVTTVVGLSKGNMARSMIGVGLALILASIGADPMNGTARLTFGNPYLLGGMNIVNLMLGMFAAKIILFEYAKQEKVDMSTKVKVSGYKFPGKDLLQNIWNMIRSWITGTVIGFLPGLGGPVAAVVAYSNEKNISKSPEFGHGHIGGVIACETANNASIGGALIPMIALGIPGDAAMVQFMAAMSVHGINASPMLMRTNPEIVYMIFTAGLIAGVITLLYETLGMKTFPSILKVPYHYLYSLVIILAFVGGAMSTGNLYGLLVMLFGCVLGILMDIFKIPSLPFLMAYILAPMFEKNFRQGMNYSANGIAEFFSRPLSCAFIIIGLILMVWPLISPYVKKLFKRKSAENA